MVDVLFERALDMATSLKIRAVAEELTEEEVYEQFFDEIYAEIDDPLENPYLMPNKMGGMESVYAEIGEYVDTSATYMLADRENADPLYSLGGSSSDPLYDMGSGGGKKKPGKGATARRQTEDIYSMANRGDHDFGAYHDVDVDDDEEQDYDTATQPTVAEHVLYARGHTTTDDTYDVATASTTDTYDVASSFGGFALDPEVLEAMANGGTIRRVAKAAKRGGGVEPLYSIGGEGGAAVSAEPLYSLGGATGTVSAAEPVYALGGVTGESAADYDGNGDDDAEELDDDDFAAIWERTHHKKAASPTVVAVAPLYDTVEGSQHYALPVDALPRPAGGGGSVAGEPEYAVVQRKLKAQVQPAAVKGTLDDDTYGNAADENDYDSLDPTAH